MNYASSDPADGHESLRVSRFEDYPRMVRRRSDFVEKSDEKYES